MQARVLLFQRKMRSDSAHGGVLRQGIVLPFPGRVGRPVLAVALACLATTLIVVTAGCAPSTGRPATRTASSVDASGIPLPSVSRIDYAHPEKYLELPSSVGAPAAIRRAASEIRGASAEQRLAAVAIWLRNRLKHDPSRAYSWRGFEEILAAGSYGSCADHAVMFGALTRALGIPTVWVKTMDADWIRAFVARGAEPASWRGHVFLEVFVEGRWMLLDASASTLYREYSPRSRLLPGERFAYDKGGDPRALVLSLDWERWKQQTRRYFRTFDVGQLPVPKGRPLEGRQAVFIIADAPTYELLTHHYARRGLDVRQSFNSAFEEYLPRAASHSLIVTVVGERFVLPQEYWPKWTGIAAQDVRDLLEERVSGTHVSVLGDGTRVTVLYARSVADMTALVEALDTLDARP